MIWVILFIISFPFGYHVIPEPGSILQKLFEPLAKYTGDHLFSIKRDYLSELISDSTGLYLDLFNCLLIAVITAVIWRLAFPGIRSHEKLRLWFITFVRYYLALQLVIYGFSKVFKVQFYQPEPNILFTKLGMVPKDLLYWSTMGVSRSYTMFLGFTELLAASLLLFRRSVILGSLISLFVLVNISAVNFSFDISVKLVSLFLLILCIYLLISQRRRFVLFVTGRAVPAENSNKIKSDPSWLYPVIKSAIIVLILMESLWIYLRARNFNDDTAARPILHGAYEINYFIANGDTLSKDSPTRWKRVYIHRDGYFIVEDMNESMDDYPMRANEENKLIQLETSGNLSAGSFKWTELPSKRMKLTGELNGHKLDMELQKIDLSNLPAIRKEFSWTIDQ